MNNSSAKADVEWVDFDLIFGIFRRQWKVVTACMVIGFVFGCTFLLSATPRYTSYVQILYERSKTNAVNDFISQSSVFQDESEFSSQLELIRSQRILRKTVDALDLHLDDLLLNEGNSGLGVMVRSLREMFNVSGWLRDEELSESDIEALKWYAMGVVASNIEVRRLGLTYIMTIGYTSENRQTAQKIAAQLAESYLNDQLDSKYDAAKHASEWLLTRIEELKNQSAAADLAVQKFRAENDLVQAGTGSSLAEAQLAGANAQLIGARGEVATKKAQFEKINEAIESNNINVVVDAALGSSIIENLRQEYLGLSKREAEFSERLGDKHVQVINLRNEMREYQRLMFDELTRIRDSARSQYEVALERMRVLESNLQSSVGETTEANRVQVRLRELEREAATYKSLLENFLEKYQSALQEQTLPINEARVIQQASAPGGPSYPKKSVILAISILLGGVFGVGIAGLREFMERFFRTGDQIRSELDLEFMGIVPKIIPQSTWAVRNTKIENMDPRAIRHATGMSNYVTSKPMSSFAETLRSVKIATNISLDNSRSKVIGVTSSLPGEGKSTISSNLAQLLAMQGAKTLLIDGDLRNPGLTRMIAPHARQGIVELLMRDQVDDMNLMYDTDFPAFKFLPAVLNTRVAHTSDILSSDKMQSLLDLARQQFDYIVVDLPPVAPVVDTKAFASQLDKFVYVVEWGKTSRPLVKNLLDNNDMIKEKCLGVILNKTVMEQMKNYRDHGTSGQYYYGYSSYYRDDDI